MSDNNTPSPFDEIIGEFEAVEQVALAEKIRIAGERNAVLQQALAKQAADRTAAEREAIANSRESLAAAFIVNLQTAVVAAGRAFKGNRAWTKADFLDAQALTEYLTSKYDAKLKVRPRQGVADVTNGIFEGMFRAERKLPMSKSLPPRYFQGGRDILSRKPKQTGQHVGSASHMDRTMATAIPRHLVPEGYEEQTPTQSADVTFINRRGKQLTGEALKELDSVS